MGDATKMFDPISDADRAQAATASIGDDKMPIVPVPADAPPCEYRHPKFGKPTQLWSYHDIDGNLIGHVARFDYGANGKGQKTYLPLMYCEKDGRRAWMARGFPEPRPFYRLPSFVKRPNATVLIVEGEKTALAAAQLFSNLVCTTTPGGAQSPGKADL